MTTITSTRARAERLAALIAEQQQLEAEAKAFDAAIAAAHKAAGLAHTRAVVQLYELLGIEPLTRTRTTKHTVLGPDGIEHEEAKEVIVQVDKDETRRTALLVEAVEHLVAQRDAATSPDGNVSPLVLRAERPAAS